VVVHDRMRQVLLSRPVSNPGSTIRDVVAVTESKTPMHSLQRRGAVVTVRAITAARLGLIVAELWEAIGRAEASGTLDSTQSPRASQPRARARKRRIGKGYRLRENLSRAKRANFAAQTVQTAHRASNCIGAKDGFRVFYECGNDSSKLSRVRTP
jgi:hypothetical protein